MSSPPVASISLLNKKGLHNFGKIILYQDKLVNLNFKEEPTTILCAYSIPFHFSLSEFLEFIAPVESFVCHYRIICDTVPNSYMVLMKFRDPYSASSFYKQYDNRLFSSMEPEQCKVIYIETIEIDSVNIPPYAFPFINQFQKEDQLPTCPVCLESMDDSTTGLLTILCQHTFHAHCISKWGDSSCPVCRYSQKQKSNIELPPITKSNDNDNECTSCHSTENLWLCLICGNIGCGRYHGAHAFDHYRQTSHNYALEIDSQRVWDYTGDGYVHRLIQNAVDGKLVELPSATDETNTSQDKLEALSIEYSYLLTSQLDSQRIYYESQIDELSSQLSKLNSRSKSLLTELSNLEHNNHSIETEIHQKETQINDLTNRKKAADKQLDEWKEKSEATKLLLANEKKTTNSILEDNNALLKALDEKENAIQELSDQVRDLTFFLEAREKVQGNKELEGGSVETRQARPSKRRGKRS